MASGQVWVGGNQVGCNRSVDGYGWMDKQTDKYKQEENKIIDGLLDRLTLKIKLNPLSKSLLTETKDSNTALTKIQPFEQNSFV